MIGRLYRALSQTEDDKAALMGLLRALKDGSLDLSRLDVSESGVNVLPVPNED